MEENDVHKCISSQAQEGMGGKDGHYYWQTHKRVAGGGGGGIVCINLYRVRLFACEHMYVKGDVYMIMCGCG